MGDEEIKVGDGRWVKSLGELLNGVKTCIFGVQLIRFYQILGATRQFHYTNALLYALFLFLSIGASRHAS